jgi:hypothetical protein
LSPSTRKKGDKRINTISVDEDKLHRYADPSAYNSPKNGLSDEFNSFKRKYFDDKQSKQTKNVETITSYRESNN